VDKTVIQLGIDRYWLYAAVDPKTNEFLHVKLFPTTNSGLTLVFLRELREKHDINDATFLIDDADHLQAALSRLGLRFHICRHGNRNSVERTFREIKRRTSSFSNTFSKSSRRQQNHGSKHSPSGGTDAKVNTMNIVTSCRAR
jgi:putative transposase